MRKKTATSLLLKLAEKELGIIVIIIMMRCSSIKAFSLTTFAWGVFKAFSWNSICISLQFTSLCSIRNRYHAVIKVLFAPIQFHHSASRQLEVLAFSIRRKFALKRKIRGKLKATRKMIIGCDGNRWKNEIFHLSWFLGFVDGKFIFMIRYQVLAPCAPSPCMSKLIQIDFKTLAGMDNFNPSSFTMSMWL